MTFRILADDRKQVVSRLEALTGRKPVYTRMPRCAYVLDGIVLEKDNTVTTDGDVDMSLIENMIEEGLIGLIENEEGAESDEDMAEAANTRPEESIGESALETPEPAKVIIALPMTGHRSESICNLVFTIYTRGRLLSKATDGDFFASKELVEELNSGNAVNIEDVLKMIGQAGNDALRGLAFKDKKVIFDGFPATDDPDKMRAWTALAAAMNRAAIRQHHIHAKVLNEPNEKFAFRTWLTRIRMNGPELKEERKILYRNLSGHTAFRTEADKEKWTAKQNAKRQALKEMKESAPINDGGMEIEQSITRD